MSVQNESALKRSANDSCTYTKTEKKKIEKRIPAPTNGKCDTGLPDNSTCQDCERYYKSANNGIDSDGYGCVWVPYMGKCYHKQWVIYQRRDKNSSTGRQISIVLGNVYQTHDKMEDLAFLRITMGILVHAPNAAMARIAKIVTTTRFVISLTWRNQF